MIPSSGRQFLKAADSKAAHRCTNGGYRRVTQPRIAIPEPTSFNPEYNSRAFPQYLQALQSAGATPVPIPLHESPERVAKILATTQGILLPGSPADLESQKFGQPRDPNAADPDPAREAVDELLLQDAFNLRKPILAICYGCQAMNVWRNGTLIQHLTTSVNHRPGREVVDAHAATLAEDTLLSELAGEELRDGEVRVNSSHHQAIRAAGDGLRIAASCPGDGTIEAVELLDDRQFLLGVQWHPERSYTASALSRRIFRAFVQASAEWAPEPPTA